MCTIEEDLNDVICLMMLFPLWYKHDNGSVLFLTIFIGLCRWEDGRPVNYTNWVTGQPQFRNGHNCVYLSYNNLVYRGQWAIGACSTSSFVNIYALCKKSTGETIAASIKFFECCTCSVLVDSGLSRDESCESSICQ